MSDRGGNRKWFGKTGHLEQTIWISCIDILLNIYLSWGHSTIRHTFRTHWHTFRTHWHLKKIIEVCSLWNQFSRYIYRGATWAKFRVISQQQRLVIWCLTFWSRRCYLDSIHIKQDYGLEFTTVRCKQLTMQWPKLYIYRVNTHKTIKKLYGNSLLKHHTTKSHNVDTWL